MLAAASFCLLSINTLTSQLTTTFHTDEVHEMKLKSLSLKASPLETTHWNLGQGYNYSLHYINSVIVVFFRRISDGVKSFSYPHLLATHN